MELSKNQKKVLNYFKKSPLSKSFYWTGGTLLSMLYLHHRCSNDLDFFSDKEFSKDGVVKFVEELKKEFKLNFVEEKKIFDRYDFFLHNKEKIRLEFVFYEHPALKKRKKWQGIYIDSLDDIAANKTMAFFDRNDPKDLFDIYFLLTVKKYSVKKLLNLTKKKFGVQFSESSFWSEGYKSFKALNTIKPLLITDNQKEKSRILKKIEEYFIDNANKYINRVLK